MGAQLDAIYNYNINYVCTVVHTLVFQDVRIKGKSIQYMHMLVLTYICIRDVKTPKFFCPARPVVHFSGPARNTIFYFRPVWASENILSSMFYNKTTNYLVLTDLQRRRLDFG